MPKKAKKGGGVKGGKTEEERLLYLQQRAQAEEELVRKREEILTLFLKDKLQKEERNTAVNLLKLNDGWRPILRQARDAELHKDIMVLSQTFERHLDSMNSIIKTLEHDLQEAEHQSAQVQHVHLQHLERLWAQQDKRLQFVQQQWENGLQHLSSRFSSEREQLLSTWEQQRAHLEDTMFVVAKQHKTVMEDIHRLYSECITSYESAHNDRLIQIQRENKLEIISKDQKALEFCRSETQELEHLLLKNQQLIQKTDEHMRSVKRLQDTIFRLREKLISSRTEKELVEQDLTVARNQLNRKAHELRDQLTQARMAARKQLSELTTHSDAAIKKLKAVIAKGEKVLRVADMCHKLESDQNISAVLFSTEEHRPETQERAENDSEFSELRQLRRSINAAVLQREALQRHKDDVSTDNQQLRLLLRQHLDAMTLSGDGLNGRHALLTVLQAPTTTAPPDTSRCHTIIEGVHAVKHALKD